MFYTDVTALNRNLSKYENYVYARRTMEFSYKQILHRLR
jgi:hypothetical protein